MGQRLYERVADQLASEIESGKWPVDGRLPSERDLTTRFGVSRPTIREAIIALELDGMVEVKTGSGVYVRSLKRAASQPAGRDIGLFELLEARALLEGESAALAATRIDEVTIARLESLLHEMEEENMRDVVMSEDADRRFHMAIAEATGNSAMIQTIEMLWAVRTRSPQSVGFLDRVRAEGVKPRIDEHSDILEALKRRDPGEARAAMRNHLMRVIDAVLEATETEAVERVRAELAEKRRKISAGSQV